MHTFGIEMFYHWVAVVCFTVAFSLHWAYIRRNTYLSRKVSFPVMLVGYAAVSAFLMQRGSECQLMPDR
jgi:NhaP-type Na+/H+ or K+/H+ antiporter